jgi:hypothetical protein
LSRLVKFVKGHWCSVAVEFVPEPEICQGAELSLSADAGVRVLRQLHICLGGRNKSKNRDKQLTHIVRVIARRFVSVEIEIRKLQMSYRLIIVKVSASPALSVYEILII